MKKLEKKTLIKKAGKISTLLFVVICFLKSNSYALDPPPLTPLDEFFVENGSGIPPIPEDWELTVEGAVTTPLALTLEELMGFPSETRVATLECVGNPFTDSILIGNALWTGVPLRTIIEETSPFDEAQSIAFHCLDGYKVQLSLDEIMQRDDDLLAYRMNGELLPPEQGYPLRLVLPGDMGIIWVQWIERIEITTATPGNSFFPVPLHAQIFTPRNGDTCSVGTHIITGMAIVGEGREVAKVEISTDGGVTWEPTQLLNYFVPNVWKHWQFTWEASQTGEYVIYARAEDNLVNQQSEGGFFSVSNFGITVAIDYDGDDDTVPDATDNCPDDYNPGQEDTDWDGEGDVCDNCPDHPNGPDKGICTEIIAGNYIVSNGQYCVGDGDCDAGEHCEKEQADHYPPGGNGIGDACDCEGDFNCSGGVDAGDVGLFLDDWNKRTINSNPCTNEDPCTGDFNCSRGVDAGDVGKFLEDWNKRTIYSNPCPACAGEPWCNYPE